MSDLIGRAMAAAAEQIRAGAAEDAAMTADYGELIGPNARRKVSADGSVSSAFFSTGPTGITVRYWLNGVDMEDLM